MRLVNEAEHPPHFLYGDVVLYQKLLCPFHAAGEKMVGKALLVFSLEAAAQVFAAYMGNGVERAKNRSP